MTWTPMSSPTRLAAAAPASVAAFTDATSPRTMAVTRPASTFCQPTNMTLAAFTIASVASTMPDETSCFDEAERFAELGFGSCLIFGTVSAHLRVRLK